jgi:NMD protein affecting ribosome stability and mRNA decay
MEKEEKKEELEKCGYCGAEVKETIDGLCEVCYYKFKEF